MRIAIVNAMPLAVEALRRALAFEPAHQVIWVASNGAEAVQRCAEQTPDLILMDLIMPIMDGVEATRRIMAETPCAIVIVTVDRHGNKSAGSVPLALDEAVRSGRVQRGQLLLLEAFGGGFTWGSALLRY